MNLHPFFILCIGMLIAAAFASVFYNCEIFRLVKSNQQKRLALKEASVAIEILQLINQLRQEEGHSVTIESDNADFNGQPNCLITCMGDWTNWEDRRFSGDTLVECLRVAVAEYKEIPVPTL